MNLKKNSWISIGLIVAGAVGYYAVNERIESIEAEKRQKQEEIREVLESRERLQKIKVDRGETFWEYATELGNHPCLKGIGTQNIITYLQKINDRKDLMAGQDFYFPIYNSLTCKRLKRLEDK